MNPKQLAPYLQHKPGCSFHQCQQYSNGLDGQPVDCDCGLIKLWNKLTEKKNKEECFDDVERIKQVMNEGK